MRFGPRRLLVALVMITVASCSSTAPSSQDWRVVIDSQGRIASPVMIASDAASLARLTEDLPPADIDLVSEVAVGLALSGPTGCEDRVVGVNINQSDDLVEPVVRLPKGPCSSVAIARVVVVAVRRTALPPAPFTIRTKFTNCSQECTGPSLSVASLA